MNPGSWLLALTGALATGLAGQTLPPRPDTLTFSDLTVGGLPYSADTAAARLTFGQPDSITVPSDPDEEGIHEIIWWYKALTLSFYDTGEPYVISWTAGRYATARGLSIGATSADILSRYGEPMSHDPTHILYALSNEDTENRGILFILTDGLVTQVNVGVVIALN